MAVRTANPALTSDAVAKIGFDALVGAENYKIHAYSAFTLLFMMNSGVDPKRLRANLAVRAAETGVIAENTWQSYVKGVETAADKFSTHLASDPEFLTIRDMGPEDAVEAVRRLYEAVNVVSGSDIREWSKLEGFEPLDKAGLKAKRAAEAKARKLAAQKAEADAFFAKAPWAGAEAEAGAGEAAPADPMAALAALLSTLDEASTLKALEAVNARLATMAKAKAAAPAPTVAPVLADDATPHPLSALGRVVPAKLKGDALDSAAMAAKPPVRPNKAA
ncbi:hypothetical protein [Methylobacterium aquaticum]|uniref:Uncharacterized protein n=1 Tax=Methylobacterium aquaticum TaxID=270351 RepID=A0A0C6FPV3_9HYPH|nr:hypothetical protein [Methylobacterium aquaticum]BAQ50313.1 hypothetical protein Maq22A_3p50310 [Methylobacterium aquaticum]